MNVLLWHCNSVRENVISLAEDYQMTSVIVALMECYTVSKPSYISVNLNKVFSCNSVSDLVPIPALRSFCFVLFVEFYGLDVLRYITVSIKITSIRFILKYV
jgi:hypothetical protein